MRTPWQLQGWTIVAAVVVFGFASLAGADEPKARKVLIIGIDGCRPDTLQRAKTPNFDALIAGGAFSKTTLIQRPDYQKSDTISGPGWSSLLTGVWADKHGVHDNSFEGRNYQAHPHLFTLLKQKRPDAYAVSLVDWEPIADFIVSGADVNKNFQVNKLKEYDGYIAADEQIVAEAVQVLKEPKLDVLFVYLGHVDVVGHTKGFHPTVPEYLAAVERVDGWMGQILAALRARPTWNEEEWLILASTDHGGQGTEHGGGQRDPEILHSFLLVSGEPAQQGELNGPTYIVDLPATALHHLCGPLDPGWKLDGRPVGLKAPITANTP